MDIQLTDETDDGASAVGGGGWCTCSSYTTTCTCTWDPR